MDPRFPEMPCDPPYVGEPKYPRCPICGEEADNFYVSQDGNTVGCDSCIRVYESWEYAEKFAD